MATNDKGPSLLAARLRDHRRYLVGLAESPVMFNADGSDVEQCRRMAADLAVAIAIVDNDAEPRLAGIGHALDCVIRALEMGGVSASKLAEMLGYSVGDLHGYGLQGVANATFEAGTELPETIEARDWWARVGGDASEAVAGMQERLSALEAVARAAADLDFAHSESCRLKMKHRRRADGSLWPCTCGMEALTQALAKLREVG